MSSDGDAIIQAIRDVAAEFPDKVDNPIDLIHHYIDTQNECPGCLVGTALVDKLGIGMSIVAACEDRVASEVVRLLDFALDEDEDMWLTRVQEAQDEGLPWSEAVRQADLTPLLLVTNREN
jgi:hypothetical protein